MRVKVTTIKSAIWFCTILLLALSFPLQVVFFSPMPSLFPYIGIGAILVLSLLARARNWNALLRWNPKAPMNVLISVYLALVFFHTGWQTMFGFIAPEQGIGAIVIYVLPVVFFLYFTATAVDREIRAVLLAMALVGLGVGLYFVYDSYSMLVAMQLNDFSLRAHEYSQFRANTDDVNNARVAAGYRSHGLLELHAVSAAWVSLGCFAALTLIPRNAIWWRTVVTVTYGVILLIALNFTSIVGFILVIFLMEFSGVAWFKGRMSKQGLKAMAVGLALFILVAVLSVWIIGSELFEAIKQNLAFQIDLAKGTEAFGPDDQSYFGNLFWELLSFPYNMLAFPPGILIGDGFSNAFGVIGKGSDYGVVETLHRLGLPLFIAIMVGLTRLVRRSLTQIRLSPATHDPCSRYLWFAVCVTIYLLFTEIHYTVWSAKSILPIVFLALALYARCLTARRYQAQTSAPSERDSRWSDPSRARPN